MSPATTEQVLQRLDAEFTTRAAPYAHRESALLALLHAVQEAYGWVFPEAEAAVGSFLGVGSNRVHEAVTFYTLFRQKPYGRHHVMACRTLTCDVTGGADLVRLLRDRLKVGPREATPDGMFSWETVECLGCCDLAPALQVNREPYRGPMTVPALAALLDELKASGAGQPAVAAAGGSRG